MKQQTILDSQLALRKLRQKNMSIARSKIKNRGRTPKWSNEIVSKIRGLYFATKDYPNVGLLQVSVFMKVPISTARKMVYVSNYRTHPDAQINPMRQAEWSAYVMRWQSDYDDYVKKENADKASSRYTEFSVADEMKMNKAKSVSVEETQPDMLRAIEGISILNHTDAYTAARQYLHGTDDFNASAVRKLARDISHMLGLI